MTDQPMSREQVENNIAYIVSTIGAWGQKREKERELLATYTALRAENDALKQQTRVYKDKHAYQWHDLYTATLTAWHEEVDTLKAECERLKGELIAYKHSAIGAGVLEDEVDGLTNQLAAMTDDYQAACHLAESTSKEWQAIKHQLAASETRVKELENR